MSTPGSDVLAVLTTATRAARPRAAPEVYTTLDLTWQRRGACREVDPSLFFGPERESQHQRRFREAAAKAICAHCPVRAACRSFALTTAEPYGIWGGTTERERTLKLERLRRAPESTRVRAGAAAARAAKATNGSADRRAA